MAHDTPGDCVLCSPDLAPLLGESRHWRLILNRNQCLLGKCMLALRRHVHLHVIPRYASPREFDGLTFSDPDYPDHYTPDVSRTLTGQQMHSLADLLRDMR